MTREEATEMLKIILEEATEDEEAVCYVTSCDADALDMAIKALEAPPNDNWEGYSERLWKNAYERGKADAEQRWIPVSERLPEVYVDVLVTDNGGGVPTVIIDACGMKDDTGERFWQISQTPVAWMEWPEPYKAESEGV